MKRIQPDRVNRQLLAILGLATALIATVATTQAQAITQADLVQQSLTVDLQHGLASQVLVVTLPAEATSGGPSISATVVVDSVNAVDRAGRSIAAGQAVDIRVIPVNALAEAGLTPAPRQPPQGFVPVIATVGQSAELRLACGYGSCERAYRILVTLLPDATNATVYWHASVVLGWHDQKYPNAGPTLAVRSPVIANGPGPSVAVSTKPETFKLDVTHPARTRLVELKVNPVDGMDYVPHVTLSANLSPVSPSTGSDPDSRDVAGASVFLVGGAESPDGSTPAPSATPEPMFQSMDPLQDCRPGQACTRTVLVSMSWVSGGIGDYVWSLTAHRVDIDRTFSEPSGVVTLTTLATFDPGGSPTSHLHLEGDLPIGGQTSTSTTLCVPAPALSGAGSAQPYRDVLPIAGSLRYTFSITGRDIGTYPVYLNNGSNGASYYLVTSGRAPGGAMGNPFGGRLPGGECAVVNLNGGMYFPHDSPEPTSGYAHLHWVLDVDLYSYDGLTYSVVQGTGSQ